MGMPTVRQRHASVLVERAGSYFDPRRRVATNTLGFVDAAHNLSSHRRVEAGGDEVFETSGVLNITFDNIVEHFVGRQAVGESDLRTALHVEDAPRAHLGEAVTVAGELVQQSFRTVLERRESADKIAEQVRGLSRNVAGSAVPSAAPVQELEVLELAN